MSDVAPFAVLDSPPRLRIRIRVQPRASRNRIVGSLADAVRIQITAAPVDGAANAALVDLLCEVLDVPRRAVQLVQGEHSRSKVIDVETNDPSAMQARLVRILEENER